MINTLVSANIRKSFHLQETEQQNGDHLRRALSGEVWKIPLRTALV